MANAAVYLQIPKLMDCCATIIADDIRGKDPQIVARYFNCEEYYTEEKIEQILIEHNWKTNPEADSDSL